MRAIAMIQPPEADTAFASRNKDADGEIRKMASAGWMNAATIAEAVIPALVEALRDVEVQVRANAANALARLDALPNAAVPWLIACTTDANDGLRMNAALALKLGTGIAVAEAMGHLLEDANFAHHALSLPQRNSPAKPRPCRSGSRAGGGPERSKLYGCATRRWHWLEVLGHRRRGLSPSH